MSGTSRIILITVSLAAVLVVILCLGRYVDIMPSVIPHPPPYDPGVGLMYATHLAERAQTLSLILIVVGWGAISLGAILGVAATVLGSTPLPEGRRSIWEVLRSQRGLVLGALTALLTAFGVQTIGRANSATELARAATIAIQKASVDPYTGDGDREAYKLSVDAKASWLVGRLNQQQILDLAERLGLVQEDETKDKTKPSQ